MSEPRPSKRSRYSWDYDIEHESSRDPGLQSNASRNPDIAHLVLPSPTDTSLNTVQQSGGNHPESSSLVYPEPFFSPATTSSLPDEYAANPRFLELQEELRTLLVTGAQSTAPSRAVSPQATNDESRNEESRSRYAARQVLSTSTRCMYLKNYMNKVAPWLDMFDITRHFGVTLPFMSQESPTLLYAMLALSARHLERRNALQKSSESLELYQEAIRLLTPMLEARDPNILATCCILCCLEMMSASPQNWRRHLEGCAALFLSYSVNGFSGGLLQAVFWCYARMDLCQAMISDGVEGTVLPIEGWIPANCTPDDVPEMVKSTQIPDMHANYAVYLCGRVCCFLASPMENTDLHLDTHQEYSQSWQRLWDECLCWFDNRPSELMPVETTTADKRTLFPSILFAHWAAISSNQLIHTACILLLNSIPRAAPLSGDHNTSTLWHARRIVGISATNPHEGCLNNALQPLWVAGKVLSHRQEHLAVVRLITSIEARTGWGMNWRIKDLEEYWGYERGELGR